MNQQAMTQNITPGLNEFSSLLSFFSNCTQIPMRLPNPEAPWNDTEASGSLEKIKEALVMAYLISNLNSKNIPLKAFMDSCEKKILVACLSLTGGNQKNAAAVMSIKPTVLFEKMRKHGISRRQFQFPGTRSASILHPCD